MRKIKITYKELVLGVVMDTIEGWIYLNKKWQVERVELPKEHLYSSVFLFGEEFLADKVQELTSYPNGRAQISEGITIYWSPIWQFPYIQTYHTTMLLESVDWEMGYWNLFREIYFLVKGNVNGIEYDRQLNHLLGVVENTFVLEERKLNLSMLNEIKKMLNETKVSPYEDREKFISEMCRIIDIYIEKAKATGTKLSFEES